MVIRLFFAYHKNLSRINTIFIYLNQEVFFELTTVELTTVELKRNKTYQINSNNCSNDFILKIK